MANLKLTYNGRVVAFPGWNGYVGYEEDPGEDPGGDDTMYCPSCGEEWDGMYCENCGYEDEPGIDPGELG